jgi:hypothetical protein
MMSIDSAVVRDQAVPAPPAGRAAVRTTPPLHLARHRRRCGGAGDHQPDCPFHNAKGQHRHRARTCGSGSSPWCDPGPGLAGLGIARKPAVVEERVEPRDLLNITVAFDHDVVDGAPAARFVQRLVELIEDGYGLEELRRGTPRSVSFPTNG